MADTVSADLVVRLLGAIDERQRIAGAAIEESCAEGDDRGRWEQSTTGDVYHRNTNAAVAVGPYGGNVEEAAGAHMAANDPRDVLRLCQSHRDLVAEWRKQAQIRDQLAVEAKGSEAHLTAGGITAGLWAAVTLVARGHGLEVKP